MASEGKLPVNIHLLLNFLVIGAVCYFVVNAVMLYVADRLQTEPVVTISPQAGNKGKQAKVQPLSAYNIIAKQNLFGEAALMKPKPKKAPPPPPKKSVEELPQAKASLNLQLYGTIITNQPRSNMAVILDRAANQEKIVRNGEEVKVGVKVSRIERFYVVVNDGSGDQVLAMEIAKNSDTAGADAAPKAQAQPVGKNQPRNQRMTVDRADLESSMNNLEKVMKDARFSPVRTEDGSGYKVTSIRDGSIYQKLNLQDGDVITSVNNAPVSNPAGLMKMYKDLTSQNTVSVEVERNGAKQTLNYDLR